MIHVSDRSRAILGIAPTILREGDDFVYSLTPVAYYPG
jgi:hypothetical protein